MNIIKNTVLFLLLTSCSAINEKVGLKDDHAIEEIAEEIIDQKAGIDIDLTPSTPEKE